MEIYTFSKIPFTTNAIRFFSKTSIAFIFLFLLILLLPFSLSNSKITTKNETDIIVVQKEVDNKLYKISNNFTLKNAISLATPAYASSDYDNANSYIAIDYNTGEIILEKNPAQQVPIASLTKIMSAVVALDLAEPDTQFTITQNAADVVPTKIGVIVGQKLTEEELLHAMLMTSANDAAQAVKDGIDTFYGQSVFIDAMNKKAAFLGLKNTHFANSQGFDNNQNYSSAQDLAILAHYALTNYPIISKIVKQDYTFLPANQNHTQFDLYNWNGLLDVYPNTFGVKIGNTPNAGYTTVVGSERNNKKILVVMLGTPGVLQRDSWTADLLDSAFSQKFNLNPVGITTLQLKQKYATWKYW